MASKIQCLMCPSEVEISDLGRHIHEHLNYFPERCADCEFRTHNQDELTQHQFTQGHQPERSNAYPYVDRLVSKIRSDTVYASRHGLGKLLQQSDEDSRERDRLSGSRKRSHGSELVAPDSTVAPEKKKAAMAPASTSRSPYAPSPPATRQNSGRENDVTPSYRGATEGNKRSRSDSMDVDESPKVVKRSTTHDDSPANLKAALGSQVEYVKCLLCKEKVQKDFVVRWEHVKERHVSLSEDNANYLAERRNKMAEAFTRALAWSELQCVECKDKHYRSASGRKCHVMKNHVPEKLGCPFCDFATPHADYMHRHLCDTHGLEFGRMSLTGSIKHSYEQKRSAHIRLVNSAVDHYFPAPFPVEDAKLSSTAAPTPRNPSPPPPTTVKKKTPLETGLPPKSRTVNTSETLSTRLMTGMAPNPIRRRAQSRSEEDSDSEGEKRKKRKQPTQLHSKARTDSLSVVHLSDSASTSEEEEEEEVNIKRKIAEKKKAADLRAKEQQRLDLEMKKQKEEEKAKKDKEKKMKDAEDSSSTSSSSGSSEVKQELDGGGVPIAPAPSTRGDPDESMSSPTSSPKKENLDEVKTEVVTPKPSIAVSSLFPSRELPPPRLGRSFPTAGGYDATPPTTNTSRVVPTSTIPPGGLSAAPNPFSPREHPPSRFPRNFPTPDEARSERRDRSRQRDRSLQGRRGGGTGFNGGGGGRGGGGFNSWNRGRGRGDLHRGRGGRGGHGGWERERRPTG